MPKKKAPPTEVEVPVPTEKAETVAALSTAIAGFIAPPTGPIPTPEPGVYANVPAEVYHRWDAISNSRLGLLDRSPAHLAESLRTPKPSSPAQVLGTITHCAVLEPADFDKLYVAGPEGDKRTKDVKAAYEALEAQYGEDYVLRPKDHALCVGVRESFRRKVRANALLTGRGENELSLVWIDPMTGRKCKARLDRRSPDIAGGAIVDLKSTRDARKRPFAKALYQYGYHRQGAMYLDACRVLGIEAQHYVIAAYEKEPPYPVALYRLDDGTLDAGMVDFLRLMRLYDECATKNEWPTAPSYPDTIEDIAIPSYAFEMIDTSGEEMGA